MARVPLTTEPNFVALRSRVDALELSSSAIIDDVSAIETTIAASPVNISSAPFNAVPNVLVDQGPAIRAAIDFAIANNRAVVEFPAGTFYLGSAAGGSAYAIQYTGLEKLHLRGQGRGVTTLYIMDGANIGPINAIDCSKLTIEGMTIDGNRDNQDANYNGGGDYRGVHGIRLGTSSADSVFDGFFCHDVEVRNTCAYGIGHEGLGSYKTIKFSNVETYNTWRDGIDFKNKAYANEAMQFIGVTTRWPSMRATGSDSGLDIRGPAVVTNYACFLHPDKAANGLRARPSAETNGPGGIFSVLEGIHVDVGGQPSGNLGYGRKGVVIADKYVKLNGFTIKNGWSGDANVQGTVGLSVDYRATDCEIGSGTILDQGHAALISGSNNTFTNITYNGQSGENTTSFVPLGEGFYCRYSVPDQWNGSNNKFRNVRASGAQHAFRSDAGTTGNEYESCSGANSVVSTVLLNGSCQVWNCPTFGSQYNNVQIAYDTVEQWQVATPPVASVSTVFIRGDRGVSSLWKRVVSEPSHLAKVQLTDGSWWEYQLENGYAMVAAFGGDISALLKAWSVSKFIRCEPGVTYNFTSTSHRLESDGVDVHIDAAQSTFNRGGQVGFVRAIGGWELTQTISSIASNVVNVADGTGYAADDIVKLISADYLTAWHPDVLTGEFGVLTARSGPALTLSRPLLHTYTTTPKIARIKSSRVRIDIGNITATAGTSSGSNGHFAMVMLEALHAPQVNIGRIGYAVASYVVVMSCHRPIIRADTFVGGNNSTGGVELQQTEGADVCVRYAGPMRHIMDWGSNTAVVYTEFSGPGLASYNEGHDMFSRGSLQAGFGGHGASYRNRYTNCVSSKATGGCFAVRGVEHSFINCRSYDDGGIAFNAFTEVNSATRGILIKGCVAMNPASSFARIEGGGSIEDCHFEGAPSEMFDSVGGLAMSGASDTSATTISNTTIKHTGQLSLQFVNLRGVVKLTMRGVSFDLNEATARNPSVASASWIAGSLNTNIVNVTMDIEDVHVRGSAGIVAGVFRGNGSATINDDSRLGNISIPAGPQLTGGLAGSVTMGGATIASDIALSQRLLQYITGPITVGSVVFDRTSNRGRLLVIADDTTATIALPTASLIEVNSNAMQVPYFHGRMWVRASGNTGSISIITGASHTSGSVTATSVNATDAPGFTTSGTYGPDNSINFYRDQTNFYIENRAGSSRTLTVDFLAIA